MSEVCFSVVCLTIAKDDLGLYLIEPRKYILINILPAIPTSAHPLNPDLVITVPSDILATDAAAVSRTKSYRRLEP